MKNEEETDPSSRYLSCNAVFSDKTLATIKSDVQRFMRDREKDEVYYQYVNWSRKDNEIVVLTMYAYAQIPLPKQYDIIFQIDQPENYVYINYTITQAIINGWAPVSQIEYGHKHIAILQFPITIPSIFELLPTFSQEQTKQSGPTFGFCSEVDFESIRNKKTS